MLTFRSLEILSLVASMALLMPDDVEFFGATTLAIDLVMSIVMGYVFWVVTPFTLKGRPQATFR